MTDVHLESRRAHRREALWISNEKTLSEEERASAGELVCKIERDPREKSAGNRTATSALHHADRGTRRPPFRKFERDIILRSHDETLDEDKRSVQDHSATPPRWLR